MYRLLIVEDDEVIAKLVRRHLETWDYDVRTVEDFRDVMRVFGEFEPHLVILDIGLPFYNGFYWCTEIRKVSDTPILFLSSMSDNMNIVTAIQMGGDDFVEKPFDLSVLAAKVQALMRRAYSFHGSAGIVEHRGVTLNLSDASVTYGGARVELTKNDYKILQLLLERAGRIVERDALIEKLWESDEFIDDNTLTVNVTRLRKKLAEIGLDGLIKTKKGIGYVIE